MFIPTGDAVVDMAVGYSNREAAFAMTAELVRSGYRRIAFLGGPQTASSTTDRLKGLSQGLAAHGLKPRAGGSTDGDSLKAAAGFVEHAQDAVGDAEMRAAQLERAGFQTFGDEREAAQIVEAQADGGEFEHLLRIDIGVSGGSGASGVTGRGDHVHPMADEAAVAVRGTVEQNTIFHFMVQSQPAISKWLCDHGACENGVPIRLPAPPAVTATAH